MKKSSIKDVFSYNIINRKHFLNEACENFEIVESLLKKLQIMEAEKIPFLFAGKGFNAKGRNAFTITIERLKESMIIKSYIYIMTLTDPKGLLYQKYVDNNLAMLLKNRIDIKSYFQSSMPLYRVPYGSTEDNFP